MNAKIEEYFQLLQSVLDVSNALVATSNGTDLDSIGRLLNEQQQLLDRVFAYKESHVSLLKGLSDSAEFQLRHEAVLQSIEHNVMRLLDMLQVEKKRRYKYIAKVQKQRTRLSYGM